MREQLAAALNSSRHTRGSTHNFYLYPARFSPEIARTIITLFSQPGDSVLDPFMGGGTSIIEGVMLGRAAITSSRIPTAANSACASGSVMTAPTARSGLSPMEPRQRPGGHGGHRPEQARVQQQPVVARPHRGAARS